MSDRITAAMARTLHAFLELDHANFAASSLATIESIIRDECASAPLARVVLQARRCLEAYAALPADRITVPREPTYDMLRAATEGYSVSVDFTHHNRIHEFNITQDEARTIWKAMVGAAPK